MWAFGICLSKYPSNRKWVVEFFFPFKPPSTMYIVHTSKTKTCESVLSVIWWIRSGTTPGQKRAEVVSNGSFIQVTRSAHLKSHTKQDPASETSQPLHQDGYSKQDRYVRHKIRLNILRTYVKRFLKNLAWNQADPRDKGLWLTQVYNISEST